MFNRYFAGLLAFIFAFITIFLPANYTSDDYHMAAYTDIANTDKALGYWKLSTLKYEVNKSLTETKEMEWMPYKSRDVYSDMFDGFWERFFAAEYFQTLNAMTELLFVRLLLAAVWLIVGLPVIFTLIYDAWMVRRMRFETFAGRNSLFHKFVIYGFWLLTLVTLAIFLLPVTLSSYAWGGIYLAYLFMMHALLSQFHRYS